MPFETICWLVKQAGPAFACKPNEQAERESSESQPHAEKPNGPDDTDVEARGKAALARLAEFANANKKRKTIALLVGDLSKFGWKDKSRNVRDIAIVGHCKDAKLTKKESCAAVYAFEHGAGREKHDSGDIRYFERMWERSRTGKYSPNLEDRAKAEETNDGRPVIAVAGGQLTRIVDEGEQALLNTGADIYQRGTLLVRPSIAVVPAARRHGEQEKRHTLSHRLEPVREAALVEMFGRAALFCKYDGRSDCEVEIDCPERIAKTYLARARWRVRPILGIVSAPILRIDGSLLDREGYDDATALIYAPLGAAFPKVPEEPTRDQARDALRVLLELLDTFPFVSGPDRAVALSMIITAIMRRALPTGPMHAVTAPTAGSGKSLLVDVTAIVATGRPCPVIAQARKPEETEKRLSAALLAGDALISIDNCEHELGGDLFCQALTQETLSLRVLGESRNVLTPVAAAFFATGNNLRIVGDLTRRTLMCALDPGVENPESREFERRADDYARERRGLCVAAALTILRAYVVAGQPKQTTPLGSFEDWSRLVRDALIWIGEADPVETMVRVKSDDPQREKLGVLITALDAAMYGRFCAASVIKRCEHVSRCEDCSRRLERCDSCKNDAELCTALREAVQAVASDQKGKLSAVKLGQYFKKMEGRILDGKCVCAASKENNLTYWTVSKKADAP